jgi:hypothetical protein
MDRASFRFASFSSQNRLSSNPRPALTRTEGRSGKGACSHTRRPFRFSHESSRWLVGVRRPYAFRLGSLPRGQRFALYAATAFDNALQLRFFLRPFRASLKGYARVAPASQRRLPRS